jgi:hypothetical protein
MSLKNKRRGCNLSLPAEMIKEAELAGGAAGEMIALAPLPVWGSPLAAARPASSNGSNGGAVYPQALSQESTDAHMPAAAGAATALSGSGYASSGSMTRTRQLSEQFQTKPLGDRVKSLSSALIRDYIAKNPDATTPSVASTPATSTVTEDAADEQSVVCALLNVPEPNPSSGESILEALLRRLLQPRAEAIQSGVYGEADGGDMLAVQQSLYMAMSPDGLGVEVNGLALGSTAHAHAFFRVKELTELDLENAEVIGRGAGGRVMRVQHLPTGEFLAVKEIYLGNDEVIKQIEAEISVLWGTTKRRLRHVESPFLINCQGIFYSEGTLYVVMELMDGSLKDALDSHGAFSEEEVRAITYQMLHGLQYMHFEKKQLHRDIKPHNVLYNSSGWVKLSDFGIASDKMPTVGVQSRQTFCGTLVYMSPNRAEGTSYGYEGDIWSLGVTVYQLALDQMPAAGNIFEVMQLRHDPPRLPVRDDFSNAFRDFVALCLDPDATAATTVTVRQLLMHEWMAGMNLDRSQRVVNAAFSTLLTRTQRKNTAPVRRMSYGQREDIFDTLDAVLS